MRYKKLPEPTPENGDNTVAKEKTKSVGYASEEVSES
jgi:hypothetical protein